MDWKDCNFLENGHCCLTVHGGGSHNFGEYKMCSKSNCILIKISHKQAEATGK